jgi:ribokinase
MANRDEWDSSDAAVVTHALEKLRARDGITLARLQRRNEGAGPLLRIAAIQQTAVSQRIEPADAAVRIISLCVAEMPDLTHRIVADAVLGLGVLSDQYRHDSLDERILYSLRSDALGKRRASLLTHWRRLHLAIGAPATDPPSDRTLRGSVEPEVLRDLARRLIALETASSVPETVPAASASAVDEPSIASGGRVIAVGAAVIDAIFRTRLIPQYETSTPAQEFLLSPGGKGLSQAVAAARLGLDVALVAAVADDQFGQEIIQHLRSHNVDTSLLKMVPNARTPVTGVFELPLGDSIAAYWRNEQQINLTVRDVDDRSRQIGECDILLASFETPRETLERTLDLTRSGRRTGPAVIVTPGQPYPDGGIARQALAQIDYLVAHTWELEKLAPSTEERFDPDRVSESLLHRGVKHVCLLGNGGGTIYSQTAEPKRLPTLTSHFKESSTTRDAFCAALSAKLAEGKSFTPAVARWVTAAMACAAEDYSRSTSMPDRDRIERKLRQTKRGHYLRGGAQLANWQPRRANWHRNWQAPGLPNDPACRNGSDYGTARRPKNHIDTQLPCGSLRSTTQQGDGRRTI